MKWHAVADVGGRVAYGLRAKRGMVKHREVWYYLARWFSVDHAFDYVEQLRQRGLGLA